MAWRNRNWSERTASQPFQVIRVREHDHPDRRICPVWEVTQAPSVPLSFGESVFVWMEDDALERGFEEAFTIVGSPETERTGPVKHLHMMSSAGPHAPITLRVPEKWTRSWEDKTHTSLKDAERGIQGMRRAGERPLGVEGEKGASAQYDGDDNDSDDNDEGEE